MIQVRSRFVGAVAGLATAALVATGGPLLAAQDAAPMAGIPNHIHQGSCANLSTVVAPLASLSFAAQGAATPMASPMAGMATPVAGMATPMASPMAGMTGGAIPVAAATTEVPLALAEILAAPHAINLHDPAAPEDPTRYLACGDLAGAPDAQGNLFVGLGEINDSGFSGTAWLLDQAATGGTGTVVTLFLSENQGGM